MIASQVCGTIEVKTCLTASFGAKTMQVDLVLGVSQVSC